MPGIVEQLLSSRGLVDKLLRDAFFNPSYSLQAHDPFLLPDMTKAVERLVKAKSSGEKVYIYGDYDIDGLTATSLLLDAFASFGIETEAFIPNRFTDGYGLSKAAIKRLAKKGARLIVTVDCGSLSHAEIELAKDAGMDVIVTDHHSVAETMPPAIAIINPKRTDHKYPFIDLAGVGVAFKLVQALQQKLEGLPAGQEKWLLDLVALGTVCDVVQLTDENRANVYWGLQVMAKTRRVGLKALISVIGLDPNKLDARSFGFMLGPHLNAAGRLETAELSLQLLTATDPMFATQIAYRLRDLNEERRADQRRITKEALAQAQNYKADNVLVLSNPTWSHGVIGIVAAKVQEALLKPTFVLQEMGEFSKGSARSFGDFSAVDAIKSAAKYVVKGGGHKLAAGVTLKTEDIANFRKALNDFYVSQNLTNQQRYFDPNLDAVVEDFTDLNEELIMFIKRFEPFGHGNPEPVFYLPNATVSKRRHLGKDGTHLKLDALDDKGNLLQLIGFGMAASCNHDAGERVNLWFKLIKNEWQGVIRLEGQLVKIASAEL